MCKVFVVLFLGDGRRSWVICETLVKFVIVIEWGFLSDRNCEHSANYVMCVLFAGLLFYLLATLHLA